MTRIPTKSPTFAETLYRRAVSPRCAPTPLRRKIAGLTAGALAISVVLASAVPVRAESDDDLLAALAALAVIGVIIAESNKDRDERPTVHEDKDWHAPDPYPAPVRRIPPACAINVETRDHRDVVFYTESCLRRAGLYDLPNACAREVTSYGRRDLVYGQSCLRRAGYLIGSYAQSHGERPD